MHKAEMATRIHYIINNSPYGYGTYTFIKNEYRNVNGGNLDRDIQAIGMKNLKCLLESRKDLFEQQVSGRWIALSKNKGGRSPQPARGGGGMGRGRNNRPPPSTNNRPPPQPPRGNSAQNTYQQKPLLAKPLPSQSQSAPRENLDSQTVEDVRHVSEEDTKRILREVSEAMGKNPHCRLIVVLNKSFPERMTIREKRSILRAVVNQDEERTFMVDGNRLIVRRVFEGFGQPRKTVDDHEIGYPNVFQGFTVHRLVVNRFFSLASTLRVRIMYLHSLAEEFVVILEKELDQYDAMMNFIQKKVAKHNKKFTTLEPYGIHDGCLVKREKDNVWYRAIVTGYVERYDHVESVKVQFVDIGGETTVDRFSILPMSNEISQINTFGIKCRVHPFEIIDEERFLDHHESMVGFLNQGECNLFVIKPVEQKDGHVIVRLELDYAYMNMNFLNELENLKVIDILEYL